MCRHRLHCIQVAQAPKATTPQVQAISELELDQAWVPNQPVRSTDINLSLLTSCLLPSAKVGTAIAVRAFSVRPQRWSFSEIGCSMCALLKDCTSYHCCTGRLHPGENTNGQGTFSQLEEVACFLAAGCAVIARWLGHCCHPTCAPCQGVYSTCGCYQSKWA